MKALENVLVHSDALDTIASSRKHVEPVPSRGYYNDKDAANIKAKLEAVATHVIDRPAGLAAEVGIVIGRRWECDR
jgi:hypothetical protein